MINFIFLDWPYLDGGDGSRCAVRWGLKLSNP
jgi:hypothetical protein